MFHASHHIQCQELSVVLRLQFCSFIVKVKVKLTLCLSKYNTMKTYWGSGGYSSTHSLPLHYMEVSGQLHALTLYPQGRVSTVPIGWEAGWAPESRSGCCGEEKSPITAPAGNWTPLRLLLLCTRGEVPNLRTRKVCPRYNWQCYCSFPSRLTSVRYANAVLKIWQLWEHIWY
jgi:hypothetical protein